MRWRPAVVTLIVSVRSRFHSHAAVSGSRCYALVALPMPSHPVLPSELSACTAAPVAVASDQRHHIGCEVLRQRNISLWVVLAHIHDGVDAGIPAQRVDRNFAAGLLSVEERNMQQTSIGVRRWPGRESSLSGILNAAGLRHST